MRLIFFFWKDSKHIWEWNSHIKLFVILCGIYSANSANTNNARNHTLLCSNSSFAYRNKDEEINLTTVKPMENTSLRNFADREAITETVTETVTEKQCRLGRNNFNPLLAKFVDDMRKFFTNTITCAACRGGFWFLVGSINIGRTNDDIFNDAKNVCVLLNIESPRVCSGIMGSYVNEMVEILKTTPLRVNEICTHVVGESCGDQNAAALQWTVPFTTTAKPPWKVYQEPKVGAPTLKVLHISDTHFDSEYEPGTNAQCGEPLCCRKSSGPIPPRPHLAAGLWGDYRKCDTPRVTIESMYDHISKTHPDVDFIIWTGDIPAHDVWNQTRKSNLETISESVNMLSQYFPHTPIFPALGNHESKPVNSFAPYGISSSQFSMDWLYKELQKNWSRWLPSRSLPTVGEGGYYSTIVKPGFKIISVNMNYCNNLNWWLLVNTTDPMGQLRWFTSELQISESANEKVWVIGHIPPGHSDCVKVWSSNYYKIISRYENTIAAQFFGHTHQDEFEIFYSTENTTRPIGVAFIGPSVTPYEGGNPGYKIYYVDGDHSETTRNIIDHETWITDLGEANRLRTSSLAWYKLYSAKEAYGLTNISPQTMNDLVFAMYKDKSLFAKYYKFYHKNYPKAPACSENCKTDLLCDLRSGRSHSHKETCRPRSSRGLSSKH